MRMRTSWLKPILSDSHFWVPLGMFILGIILLLALR
jgi:hypothetical protein